MNRMEKFLLAAGLLLSLDAAAVATCTSIRSGNWNTSSTWSCVGTPAVTTPGSSNIVVIASGHTVSLNNNNRTVASLTIEAGATLNDDNQDLTVTGDVVNNGTFGTNGGALIMRGSGSTLSGTGTFDDTDVQIDANGISLPAGSTMNFTNQAEIRVGRDNQGSFTLNGAVTGTGLSSGDRILRVYENSSVILNGSISAPNAYVRVEQNASVTNNGSVNVQYLDSDGSNPTAVWTQGANSSLTVSLTPSGTWRGTLNASATGNTVTYNSPATPLTPSSSTYYNLAGTGVTCPHGFTVLGSDPCGAVPGVVTVTMSPGSCVNTTGIGSEAWSPSPTTNVNSSNNSYATATVRGTTNYLKCTGYGFNIPATATILGVVVNVERKSSSSSRTYDAAMRLVKAGVIGSVDRSKTTTYTTQDVVEAHGTSTDLWGVAWTPADINLSTFGAAFAARTTRTRTVSVDHMPISVTYSEAQAALHHIQIEHDGAGLTCASEQLTIKACADAACSSTLTTENISGNVTWAGSPGGTIPFSIASGGSGQTTVNLPVTTAQTVTLGTSSVSPTPAAASSCATPGGGTSCNLTFTASTLCMDAVEVGAAAGTPIYTKLSGTGFSLDVRTVSGANYTGTVSVELVDASTGSCASFAQLNTQNVTFSNQKVKTVSFNYANASKNTKVRMKAGSASASCSSDRFAIRPVELTIASSANADAAGASTGATPAVAAGANFTLTATAVPGYNGTPAVDGAQVAAHAGAVAAGSLGGSFGAANAATGTVTGNAFTYGEVGYFRFGVNGVKDTTFADVDRLNGDCTNDYSNDLAGGKYGCYFGNTAATSYFGRFVPDHFDTAATDECDVFTYSGQPFALEVQARDVAGTMLLQNYDGAFAKGLELSDALNAATLGSFTPGVVLAADFAQGAAAVTPAYTFANVRTAPAVVGVRVTEAAGGDGVSSAGGTEGSVHIRSGRVWMGNAYGSELLNLPVPVFAQYWDGSAFVTNVDDDVAAACTSVPVPAVTLLPGGTAVTATMNAPFVAGNGGLVLAAPGVSGQADVTLNVPAWLQYDWAGAGAANPTARATFGVYQGNDVFIYRGRRGR